MENLNLSINKNNFLDSISPRKSINTNLELQKTKKNKFKRAATNVNNQKKKSNYHRLNTNYKSLKEQLKKSIVLRPEELDISSINDDLENTVLRIILF